MALNSEFAQVVVIAVALGIAVLFNLWRRRAASRYNKHDQ